MPELKLPQPISESWDWQIRARCRGVDPAVFFHPDNERGDARRHRVGTAIRICRVCPVQAECRRYALEAGERYGIWGGLPEDERRAGASAALDSRGRSRVR